MGWGLLGGLGQGMSSVGQDLTIQARDDRIQEYKQQERQAEIKRQDSLLQQKLSREDRIRAEDQARADAQAKSAAEYQAQKDAEDKRRWEIEQRNKISGEKWKEVKEPLLDAEGNVVYDAYNNAQTRTVFVNHASGEKRYLDDYGSPGAQSGPALAGGPAKQGGITPEQVAAFREKNPNASWQDLSTLMKQRGVEVDPRFEAMFPAQASSNPVGLLQTERQPLMATPQDIAESAVPAAKVSGKSFDDEVAKAERAQKVNEKKGVIREATARAEDKLDSRKFEQMQKEKSSPTARAEVQFDSLRETFMRNITALRGNPQKVSEMIRQITEIGKSLPPEKQQEAAQLIATMKQYTGR